jgi:hypothetical protein
MLAVVAGMAMSKNAEFEVHGFLQHLHGRDAGQ